MFSTTVRSVFHYRGTTAKAIFPSRQSGVFAAHNTLFPCLTFAYPDFYSKFSGARLQVDTLYGRQQKSIRNQEQTVSYGLLYYTTLLVAKSMRQSALFYKRRESLQSLFYELSRTGEVPAHEAFALPAVHAAGIEP